MSFVPCMRCAVTEPRKLSRLAFAGGFVITGLGSPASAQVETALSGPPVQVAPYVPEPGVPLISITPGGAMSFSSGVGTSTDGGTSAAGVTVSAGSNDPLTTMVGQPWGAAAVANAQLLGVNPAALAATCAVESGCQNVAGSGTVAGAFQMTASTYTAMINAAVANNPSLASQIVPGLAGQMDPATESIAASEYLLEGAQKVQAAGVSDPTALDVRGYFNYGPSGAALATASDNETMAQAMPNVSQQTFTANNVTSTETVGQWRASMSAKMGTAASQSVFNS